MNVVRTLGISIEVLLGHRLRTFLSSIGIAIGVTAVVIMVGSGQAAGRDVVNKVKSMGTNLLMVQAARFSQHGTHTRTVATFTTLKPRDVRQLRLHLRDVSVSGYLQRAVIAKYRNLRTRTNLAGADSEVFRMRGVRAADGMLYFSREERSMARVAVIGPTVDKNLFEGSDPVGKRIEINKVIFRIIGVAETRGQDLAGNDQDDVIYIPLKTAMSRVFHVDYLQTILIQGPDEKTTRSLEPRITAILRKDHHLRDNKDNDFTIQDQSQLLKSQEDTSQAFTLLVGSVAGISLFTGGIGILAVMLISIRERTREIGLRRAIGGRKKDILLQFLLEAAALSTSGALIGLIIGLIGNYITCRLLGWPVYWPWSASGIALTVSFLMGVIFGIYPAMKAARLQPATALHAAG